MLRTIKGWFKMLWQYKFSDKIKIVLESSDENDIVNYFNTEYIHHKTSENDGISTVGIIRFRDKIDVPRVAVAILKNEVIVSSQSLYFIYEDRKACINVKPDHYEVIFENNFHPLIAFVLNEVLLRIIIVNYDLVLLHASSFKYKNQVFIINAFGGSGKTNLLLDVLEDNGIYLSDDLGFVDIMGNLYPYKKRINLLYYNFNYKKNVLKKIGGSNILLQIYNILLRSSNTWYYKHLRLYKITGRLHNKLNIHVNYKDVTNNDDDLNCYKIDEFIWLELSARETSKFNINKEYFTIRMKKCLKIESRYLGPWYDLLEIVFPCIGELWKKQDEMIDNISNLFNITGINKKYGDEDGVFHILRSMLNKARQDDLT